MKLLRLPGCTKRLQILLVENVCTDRLAIFTARKRSLGQGNIFYTCLSFCSRGGGGVWLGGVPVPRGACSRGSACSRGVPALGVPGGDPPTPGQLLLWAVCTLLECILVCPKFKCRDHFFRHNDFYRSYIGCLDW